MYEAVSGLVSTRLAERARADDTLGRTLSVMVPPRTEEAREDQARVGPRKPVARQNTRGEPVLKLTRTESR